MKASSFTAINYSLRPSKTIQRGLVFEGLRRLQELVYWDRARYIGFGSIWFTDFILAHKILGLSRMISIENNLIGYRRAQFNKPYRFVSVRRGFSYDVLPVLFEMKSFQTVPAIIWLDYDEELDEDKVQELRDLVSVVTADSVILVTFNAGEKHYGKTPVNRLDRLQQLFGNAATRRLTKQHVDEQQMGQTLASLASNLIANTSRRMSKPNPCVPAFRIAYRDKASMVTVGAIFPREDRADQVRRCVSNGNWPGIVDQPLIAPHLTNREVSVLQSRLPPPESLTRRDVQELGFDLEVEQLRAFESFYRYYPTFAQILS